MQLFDSGMRVRWIDYTRREPNEHAHSLTLLVRRQQLAPDTRRHLLPFRFVETTRAGQPDLTTRLTRDSTRLGFARARRGLDVVTRPIDQAIHNGTKPFELVAAIVAGRQVCFHLRRRLCGQGPQRIDGDVLTLRAMLFGQSLAHRLAYPIVNNALNRSRPERTRDLMVAVSIPSRAATSAHVCPVKKVSS